MDFIAKIPGNNIPWFLDTEEKVRDARRILEEATEPEFERLRLARLRTLECIRDIILE